MLPIEAVATRAVELEDPGLNDGRTSIELRRVGDPDPRILTGSDHRALHGSSADRPLATAEPLAAGECRHGHLRLLDYAPPLAPGRYEVRLAYRCGPGRDDVVRSSRVEFQVVCARGDRAVYRWFRSTEPRETLEAVRLVHVEGAPCLLYQVSHAAKPAVLRRSVRVSVEGLDRGIHPRPARLAALGSRHAHRILVWLDGEHVLGLRVGSRSVDRKPSRALHGLEPLTARLVDPPLHLRARGGGHLVVTTGLRDGAPTAGLHRVDSTGHTETRHLGLSELPKVHAVSWGADEAIGEGSLWWARDECLRRTDLVTGRQEDVWKAPESLTDLVVDPECANVYAVLGEVSLKVYRFALAAVEVGPLLLGELEVPAGSTIEQVVPLAAGEGVALLVSSGEGWWVIAPGLREAVPPTEDDSPPPALVAGRGGVVLIEGCGSGYLAARVLG